MIRLTLTRIASSIIRISLVVCMPQLCPRPLKLVISSTIWIASSNSSYFQMVNTNDNFSLQNGFVSSIVFPSTIMNFVSAGTSMPARLAIFSTGWATISLLKWIPSGHMAFCSFSRSDSLQKYPPCFLNSIIIRSYTLVWITTEFSDEQDVALSKHLPIRIFSAAATKSAVSSTMTTALPAPTP